MKEFTGLNAPSIHDKELLMLDSGSATDTKISIHDKIEILLRYLNSGLYGKEEAVRLSLLSAIAGESVFFMGPPGTAKSMIARRLKNAFKEDATYFEYLMNEFSTPDEICGPVSLKSLENDEYKRITKGYLPTANIAFLDEIWKSGPAILNTLLTLINEKKFHNGRNVEDVPLKALISASNEFPAAGRGLEALWDRFIVRVMVNPVDTEEAFFNLCEKQSAELTPNHEKIKNSLLSLSDLEAYGKEIRAIALPDTIKSCISAIRAELAVRNADKKRDDAEKYYVSDRRWKKIVNLLKASAYLNGRAEVDLMDLQLVEHCLWSTTNQRKEIGEILRDIAQENGLDCMTTLDDLDGQITEYEAEIDKTWYKMIKGETKEEPVIVEHDGTEYYELKDKETNIKYVTVDETYSYYNRHACFEANWTAERDIDHLSIDLEKKLLLWKDGDTSPIKTKTIIIKEPILKKNDALFDDPTVHTTMKAKFDAEKYAPIAEGIRSELQRLADYRKQREEPFRKNLFAKQDFAEIILSGMTTAQTNLENLQVKLDKAQHRYDK